MSEQAPKEPEAIKELPLDEAVQVAVELHRMGQFSNAEKLYSRILDAAPRHADAMHFYGVLLHQRGRSAEGLSCIEQSILLGPATASRHINMGNVLLELERHDEAERAYRQAIACSPDDADAYNNLGALLRARGALSEARDAYLEAIALFPDHVDAHNNLGNLYSAQGDVQQAVICYSRAVTLMPGHAHSRKFLGMAYYTLGQIDKATEVYRQWVADEPDNPVARHMVAACSGQDVPGRASDAYIENTFDSFAASFDAKLGKLGYRAPELVATAVREACGEVCGRLDVLDAGCGTGLCGPLIAPYARRITGVDLSAGMLQRAAARGVYHELVKAEMQAYLAARPSAYDLVISADTLVYFGALDALMAAASRSLRPGGLLIFSVEALADDEQGFRINPHGRYSHSAGYLRRQAAQAGLAMKSLVTAELRTEGGKAVDGLVATCRKPAG
jgi:predicted TPR repeat methyltransferase